MAVRTYGEVVSRIISGLNSLQLDDRIPRRFVLDVFKENAEFLLAQKLRENSLFREDNLYKWIDCIEMEPISPEVCGIPELRRCKSLKVSKKKLPKLLYSRFGNSIRLVTNVLRDKVYSKRSVATINNHNNRENSKLFDKNEGHYYISEGKLYIPDGPSVVNMYLMTLDDEAEYMSECCDECKSVWDMEITMSDKLYKTVIDMTIQQIVGRLQIPKDENTDLDSNVKVQTSR